MTSALVVEDECGMRYVLEETLRDAGFNVISFASADEAVPALSDGGLGLIVTDINLPGRLDGIDLALAAYSSRPDVPVIVISGQPAMLEKAKILCSRATSLKKPFGLKIFLEEVDRLARSVVLKDDSARRKCKLPC